MSCGCHETAAHLEQRTLWVLLAINAGMFVLEAGVGWFAQSTGLLADSLDMLADALVYGTALMASGRSLRLQQQAATASGWLQIMLGVGVAFEVVRRFVVGSEPVSGLMMVMGGVALIGNVTCLLLLAKHRRGGVHMRASWIFSTNDVIANLGVILSGAAVWFFNSAIPDLCIGATIAMIVVSGGWRILRETQGTDCADALY